MDRLQSILIALVVLLVAAVAAVFTAFLPGTWYWLVAEMVAVGAAGLVAYYLARLA